LLQIRINCFFFALDFWIIGIGHPKKKKKRNKTKQNKTIHQDLGIGGEKGRRENDANIW